MSLEDIGFYTLCDERCENLSPTSPMWRCEMVLTERCNFSCSYCRGLREDCLGDIPPEKATGVLAQWASQGLRNVRFSGGEPLVYPYLKYLVRFARTLGVERIAVSTNGSFPFERYKQLIEDGVNDFSILLDACCASDGGLMSGVKNGVWYRVVSNIRALSKLTYVTAGIVLTENNVDRLADIVQLAHNLGVADIRIVPAQYNVVLKGIKQIPQEILDAHPIMNYRVQNILKGRNVRGIEECDSPVCCIPLDDSVVCGDFHFPCVIYMREHGEPVGRIGPDMRNERAAWSVNHDPHNDPVCRKNCPDVCIDHNNECARVAGAFHRELGI